MSKNRDKAPHQLDSRGKRYAMLPIAVMDSEAYRQLSFRGRAVLMLLLKRFNFYNNNHPEPRRRLMISARELAIELNNQNHRANSKAMAELVEHGFVDVAMDYPKAARKAREYRITFAVSGHEDRLLRATNEYLQWRPIGKKGKKCVEHVATDSVETVAPLATETKVSVEPSSTGKRRFSQKPVNPNVEHVATLGSYQVEAENTAAPDEEPLRARTILFLVDHPRGTQGLLAKDASIPEGTLSKFINHEGPLSPHSRILLAGALCRLDARAQKGRAA